MRDSRLRRGINTAIGITVIAIMLFPLYWMVNVSLTPSSELLSPWPALFPGNPTFDGYRAAFSSQLPSLLTSIGIGVGTAALALLISIPAAYAMGKLHVRGSGAVMFTLLIFFGVFAQIMGDISRLYLYRRGF